MACHKDTSGKWTFKGAKKPYNTEKEAMTAEAVYRAKKKDLLRDLVNIKKD